MSSASDLHRAFESDEHELRVRQSKIACVLGIVLIPAGISLDAVSYPDYLATLFAIRIAAALVIGGIFFLHFFKGPARYVNLLTMTGLLVAVTSIAVMIGLTDGASSSYYLGLFLILFAVGVLSPMKTSEVGLFCVATIAIYIAGCFAVPNAHLASTELLNNLYFLILTSIISVTSAHFHNKQRFNEFALKYKLAAQHEELSALDRLKSQFFANVSHELRTPLTLILAPVEKLKLDAAAIGAGARELLDIVENNALRLLRLVNDILSLIRLEEGRTNLAMKTFDVGRLLRLTASSMKYFAEIKSISLTLGDVPENLFILADADAMEKIVSNIITNAIKFTPEGGRIHITAEHDGEMVVVQISDTGIGIPADKLPHIFDRFYQVDGSTTRRHQGLGLGLALVRELVSRHGGQVAATSTDGDGTTFRLSFPHLSRAEEIAEADATTNTSNDPLHSLDRKASQQALAVTTDGAADQQAVIESKPDQPLILVVDDEPDMRRYLVAMLREDYRVIEAGDGTDGLAKAEKYQPDLILLDVMLPGISGLDVCKDLKNNERLLTTKVIILTARADEEAKIIALKHGADDFLVKPFSGLEVRTRIVNLLRAARLEHDLQRANAELTESLRQLRETEAALVQNARLSALGTMAAGLLHEIGNPLNFMGTALQLAARDTAVRENSDTLDTLMDIQAGYDRIHRVVTDLRGFTAPQRPDNPRPFDISDAISHALRFTAHVQKGVKITTQLSETRIVLGSQSTISQVLVNLLLNALAAVRAVEELRPPEIVIETRAQGQEIFIHVRDNGTGIDPTIQEKIFDPFFSTKEVGEGMGLGLAVSHRIITNHGGSLNVKSTQGEYSEFIFNLQIAPAIQKIRAINEAA